MPRFFTLDQARLALPGVERMIREAMTLKTACDDVETRLRDITRSIMMSGGRQIDREAVLQLKTRRETSLDSLKQIIEKVHETGCLIKDLDAGLLDFPTLYRGREVYLCWKAGEEGIAFWHGVDEGFRGRKAIDQDFLANHTGDPD